MRMTAFDTGKYGKMLQDVTYREIDGQALKLDVYFPSTGGPWPGMIFVHGGGWTEGDKAPMAVVPAEAGILVVSINYRMYPAYRFPAMIEDVKCAIRYLRAHAAEYNLDPARIALIGHSAGGHLAALAGLAGEDAGWDTGPYAGQSSQVQAVVTMSGPSDLTQDFPAWVNELKAQVFGADQWVKSSPITYARQDAPPFMIVHGDCDDAVPLEQAQALHAALIKAGADSQLVVLKNASHGFEPVGGTVTPSMDETLGMMLGFLARTLKL
jgi:acetyl esterase/lipase